MKKWRRYLRRSGFSLVELLVVLAIVSVLAGFIYASLGGVREKARQGVCISHLRQIGQAVAMYRQDYGGSDAPGWPAEMGLPPTHALLVGLSRPGGGSYLPGGREVLYCPGEMGHEKAASSYGWNVWWPDTKFESPDAIPLPLKVDSFPAVVGRRGGDYPLMYDGHHNFARPDRPPPASRFVIVLRLDGHVQALWTTAGASWEY